jgi:hypothetical protein
MLQIEQCAVISSITLVSLANCCLQYQLELEGLLRVNLTKLAYQTSAVTVAIPYILDASSETPFISGNCQLLNLNPKALHKFSSNRSPFANLKRFDYTQEIFSICEASIIRLDHKLTSLIHTHFVHESDFLLLQAKNLHLCQLAQSAKNQERANIICTDFSVLQLPCLSKLVRLLFPHELGRAALRLCQP